MLLSHVEPLTEQQIVGVYGLQQSALETEEALSQGLEALYQSLSDTVVSDALSCPSNVANYMGQMAAAMTKLSTLEGFVRQVSTDRCMIQLIVAHHITCIACFSITTRLPSKNSLSL